MSHFGKKGVIPENKEIDLRKVGYMTVCDLTDNIASEYSLKTNIEVLLMGKVLLLQ